MKRYFLLISVSIFFFQLSPFAKNYLSFINQNISSENIRVVEILNKEQYLVSTNSKGIKEIQQRQCDYIICDIITHNKSYYFVYPENMSRCEIEKFCTVLYSFSDCYLVTVDSDQKLTMLESKPVKLHRISIDIPDEISATIYVNNLQISE